ncbi:adenylyltransferase/cytidyltransferase family protein [Nitrosomonas communis]|uniref:adenylyltransferase/cytidyltransferase family protein n=1 Tax=Nitrosomonas communis TaxID=44574 RepID=UPI0026EB4086|nr:adenylyltransferase/cytidyltransferase family protein [Nitrosomonas communis]MCO6427489.1 adenylyltransferase/cytidyltransferase family protein [Nitrosomonas communis]
MTKKLTASLRQARDFILVGNSTEAANILNPLKREFPSSPDVARLWCSLAMRSGQATEVPAYAAKFYATVQGDLQKARWAQIMGTASFLLLDLTAAHAHFTTAINHLLLLAQSGKAPKKKQPEIQTGAENIFTSGKAEKLLWSTCAELASQGIAAFPFAGTLLGIVRNGHLLEFDKDLDIAVWIESWEACCKALEKMGWCKVPMGLDYSNYRDYVHSEIGITLDLCGLQHRNEQQIIGGFALPDHPAEYQRVSVFPTFDLVERPTEFGKVWFPQPPEKILTAFYGDWRTPNPYWDTVISALNLEKFTLLVRCYAYHRLIQRWLAGDLVKAWSYAHQIALKDADDVIILRSRQWLEKALSYLGQDIPSWPMNRLQKRVYTRMVADLFHEGHVNFLREARALGTHLTVCVVPDTRVLENKGKFPVMTQAERVAVVSACKYVDAVITESPVYTTPEFMEKNGFAIYAFACASQEERMEKYKLCATLPPSMIKEISYTPGISTSDLVMRILNRVGNTSLKSAE